jgi:hypothetical protein
MRAGDLVCILDGCRFPMILRRQEYVYRLVGAGHVNGIMNGEAAEEWKKKGETIQTFEIR